MLRTAVIGCGAIGAGAGSAPPALGVSTHADAYATHRGTRLVAVCDADRARAQACALRLGVRAVHTDAAALLADVSPDLVSICTPDATHAELVELVLRAPSTRGVLAEKPLALDTGDARSLAALARERGVVLAVNYSRRFSPAYASLREVIADGGIGELQHVHGAYVKGLKHNGTHWLDLLRLLVGPPVAVRGWDRLGEGGEDPTLDAELTLPGGAGARLAALDTTCFTIFEMDLLGTHGRIRMVESGHQIETWEVDDDPRHAGYRVLHPQAPTTDALRDVALHAVADLARSVRDGGEPACTGEDGAAALALAEAIRASAEAGGAILTV